MKSYYPKGEIDAKRIKAFEKERKAIEDAYQEGVDYKEVTVNVDKKKKKKKKLTAEQIAQAAVKRARKRYHGTWKIGKKK